MKQKCTRVCSYSTWTIPELCTDSEKAFGGVYNPLNGDSFPTSICSSVCFVHLSSNYLSRIIPGQSRWCRCHFSSLDWGITVIWGITYSGTGKNQWALSRVLLTSVLTTDPPGVWLTGDPTNHKPESAKKQTRQDSRFTNMNKWHVLTSFCGWIKTASDVHSCLFLTTCRQTRQSRLLLVSNKVSAFKCCHFLRNVNNKCNFVTL